MENVIIYRCNRPCPIGKKCFILKTLQAIPLQVTVLVKCPAEHGKDVSIRIGGNRPP